ncbi:unnamed protein product [Camellia sinensis]
MFFFEHLLVMLCFSLNVLASGFVDLVIEFDLKVTLFKGLRQELTSRYLLHINIYIYTRMYTITHVDEVKREPTENP